MQHIYINTCYGSLYSGSYKKDFIESEAVDEIIIDRNADRSGMAKMFNRLKAGDNITVFTICELSESDCEIFEIINMLYARGVDLYCVQENFDTRNPNSDSIYALFAAIDHGRSLNRIGFDSRFSFHGGALMPETRFESF